MSNKQNPIGYIFAGLIGALAGAVSMIGLGKMIPNMMVNCMKKMREEGGEMPECCKDMMNKPSAEPKARKTSSRKRKSDK